jgi:hypothetical protein
VGQSLLVASRTVSRMWDLRAPAPLDSANDGAGRFLGQVGFAAVFAAKGNGGNSWHSDHVVGDAGIHQKLAILLFVVP